MDDQIQNTRYCQLKGHEESRASYISIYKEGKQTQQWLCADCILQYFDNHGQPNLNHIMKQKLFLDYIKQQSQHIYRQSMEEKKLIQIWIKGLQQSIQYTQSLISQLQEDLVTIDNTYNIKEIEEIIIIANKDHNLLTNQQIDKLINLHNSNKKYDQNLSSGLLKNIIQQYLDLQKLLSNKNNECIKILTKDSGKQIQASSNKIIEIKNKKYRIKEIDYCCLSYYASQISQNEKYLAYGGENRKLKIYDLNQKKIIKKIYFDAQLMVCKFNQDSSQLYVGLSAFGFVHGYDVQNDFKEIFEKKIHSDGIKNILVIPNDYLITCSDDQTIIKTDIKKKQQIFKLTGHTSYINDIDYDNKDEIIVSGSDDQSIKLWDCRSQSMIIDKEQSHNNCIRQIQLINNNLNILSLDESCNLYKWKIDLINKDLIKLQQFSDQNKIYNFYQLNQDQNLLLICNNYVKILNQQGDTINTIQYSDKENRSSHSICNCRQLDNLKYIQIRLDSAYKSKIILAIAQD